MSAAFSDETIERLIRISKEKPLLPETFVPWHEPVQDHDTFLPDVLISLQGHPLWDRLTPEQQRELGRHEVVQSMYSYAWTEGLACMFFNRRLLTLMPDSVEYRFLLRELIEECRHQEMFSAAIDKIGGKPITAGFWHRFWSKLTVRYMPDDGLFISVLAIELMTDIYGKYIRRDKAVLNVLRKVSELHNIEEGRHIHYAKLWLQRYTQNAGFFRRTTYSIIVLLNLYFLRTLYVNDTIFERIGVENPKAYTKAASRNLRDKLSKHCLKDTIEFVQEFNGFNAITRPLWRWIMNVTI
jgi:P-aminobenzoate N-oxygenase AurF